jgi:hypothetical protein
VLDPAIVEALDAFVDRRKGRDRAVRLTRTSVADATGTRDILRAYDAVHTSPSDAVNVSPTLFPPPRRRRRRSGPRDRRRLRWGSR